MRFVKTLALSGCALAAVACTSPEPEVIAEGADAGHEHDAAPRPDAAAPLPDAAAPRPDASSEPSVEELCGTRTMYPGQPVIDPDDPTYSDARWTNEDVRARFAEARAADNDAYHAYRTAHARPDLMYCGFCTCGCNESIGHESGIDCFKDMHGFG